MTYRPFFRHRRMFAIAAALLLGPAAFAEEQVIALSPAEKSKLLDAAADRRQSAANEAVITGAGVNGIAPQVHGQVGMFVGTGGARGVFGSAVAPIGQNGSIAFAFENSRFGR